MAELSSLNFRMNPRIGLGCMGFSWAYNQPGDLDEEYCVRTIRDAYEAGVRHFDTSDMYSNGHNERLVGEALKELPDAQIATKGGIVVDSVDPLEMHVDGSRKHLAQAVDRSLERLGRDHIDLYYLHRADSSLPIQEQVEVLAEAQRAGKIVSIGLSEVSVNQLQEAAKVAEIAAVQSEFSIWTRGPARRTTTPEGSLSVLDWCEENETTLVAFSPLGRGYLTGEFDENRLTKGDFRLWMPRFTSSARARNKAIVDAVGEIANRHQVNSAQVALSWVLAQSPSMATIPGSTSLHHIVSNLEARDVRLSDEELRQLNELPEPAEPRY